MSKRSYVRILLPKNQSENFISKTSTPSQLPSQLQQKMASKWDVAPSKGIKAEHLT
jgi:hypothetical protein